MSDALINGLAGAGGGIIAQLITYPLQTVPFPLIKFYTYICIYIYIYLYVSSFVFSCCWFVWCDLQVNTRQQTERDLKKEKRKLGTIEQMSQVLLVAFFSCIFLATKQFSLFCFYFSFVFPRWNEISDFVGCKTRRMGKIVRRINAVVGRHSCFSGD